ncbi:MAG TPA: glycosyltransferase [Clostridiaceae bacterium]|nr:glycosyltransferase [Clostridiaceae bacterium]
MSVYEDVLVSIIIPVYNVGDYLERCIDSIRQQTHKKIEIILVDDGSTDNSPRICDYYAKEDSRIIVIHQENRGAGPARNAGIDIAHGEWICFVDSDDYISPLFVERLLKIAVDNDCLTAQCRFKRVLEDSMDENEKLQPEIKVMDWRNYFIYVYKNMCRNPIGSSGHTPFGPVINIYHKSLFDSIRFPSLRISEDIEIMPRIIYAAGKKNIAITDEILYYYFQRPGSSTRSEANLSLVDRYYAINSAVNFLREKKENEVCRLFNKTLFDCMVRDYLILCAELPAEHHKYGFLKDEIYRYLGTFEGYCSDLIVLRPDAKKIWENVLLNIKDCVIYGYGDWGKEFTYWFRYFEINIIEIWDQKAETGGCAEGIPFRKAHDGLEKNTCIIVAIADRYVSLEVACKLRELGYTNIYDFTLIESGLRYGKYSRFMPSIIENYRRLFNE